MLFLIVIEKLLFRPLLFLINILLIFFQMNQSCSDRLRALINNIVGSETRITLGENKNQLKLFLEQCSTSNQSLMVIQEFLAFCIKYKRLSTMVSFLNQSGQLLVLYSPQLEEITKKYILATPQPSKLDQIGAKQVRLLLTKKLLQDQTLLSSLIIQSRNDQAICLKLLRLISQYFKQRKPIGHITQIVVLAMNLIRVKDQISNQMICTSLNILNIIGDNSQELKNVILPAIINQVIQLYKSGKVQKQSLQSLNSYLKQTNKLKQSIGVIQSICQVLKTKIKQKQKYLKTQKQYVMSKEQSEQVAEFINICFSLIRDQGIVGQERQKNRRNKSNKVNDNEMVQGYQGLFLILMQITKQTLLILNQSFVPSVIQQSCIKMQGLQLLFLSQSLINCVSYSLKKQQNAKNTKQLQIISYIHFWLQGLGINEKNKIRTALNLEPQNPNRLNSEPAISLFGDFIRKSIQNQFQYQFNKQLMRSVCNLVCFLAPILEQSSAGTKSKQFVMNIVKMLLNLNQSCEKQYRQFLVYKILKIITVYGKQLIKDNQFLSDVLQSKLIQSIITYKEFLIYLNQQQLLSEQFYQKIFQKISRPQILEAQSADIQFIFDILVYHNKQKMQTSNIGWQWSAFLHSSGRKIFGKQWDNSSWRQLKNIKDSKMLGCYLQFGQDINKIEGILGRKY